MTEPRNDEKTAPSDLAKRRFRKDVDGFRARRRRLELEDLLRVEREKPEALRDPEKIAHLLRELEKTGGENPPA